MNKESFIKIQKKSEKEKLEEVKKQEEVIKNRKFIFDTKYPLGLTNISIENTENYICPKCRNYENTPDNIFNSDILKDIFCLRKHINCTLCGSSSILREQIRAHKTLINTISMDGFNNIYQMLGSKTSIGSGVMKENQINEIDFGDMYIPKNAKILDINLTPSCNLFPLKLMSNNTRYTQDVHENKFSFFPANLFHQEKQISNENGLSVMVQWLVFDEKDIVDNNLLQAIDNFIDNKPYELIMNANRTLELICNRICFNEFIKNYNNKDGVKSVKNFLSSGASYGYQLKYLLNLVCKGNSLVEIEKELIKEISSLNKKRNDIAHEGQLKDNKELTTKEKEEILAIAILGSSLMKYICEKI